MNCKATTASGQACKMPAQRGQRYCFTHSPQTRAAQAQARKAGGEARHTPHAGDAAQVIASPRSVDDTFSILDYALAETLVMDNGIQRNRLLVSIAAQYIEARKVGDLEKQLQELMRILASRPER